MQYNTAMDIVEDIKQRLNIEDVIGEYVELKRSGRNFKGLSPFTGEKTASFMVSPEKQIWHDFSSNKGGTMFTFVMEMEGVDFRGSLDILARKAGLDISLYSRGSGTTAKRKEKAFSVAEAAASFYQHALLKYEPALAYLRRTRAYSKQTITDFRFGYSPTSGNALQDYLSRKGFTAAEMQDAGVITKRRNGWGDMFRGRVMVPLSDGQGRVVGFTARILQDEPNAPKYINTPTTLIYDKGRQLFGLHMAKQAIRQKGFAVVVEGNLDVVASHQAGVANVVAVAGTALTLDHLKSLSRLTDDVRFAFDQDRAGVAATERAIPMAQGLGLKLSIIDVPHGKDPDELIKQDKAAWRKLTEQSVYVMDWLFDYYQQQVDLASAQGKTSLGNLLVPAIHRLQDPVEQEHYLQKLAEVLGVSLDTIERKFMQSAPKDTAPRKRHNKAEQVDKVASLEQAVLQDKILALGLITPRLRSRLAELPADLLVGEQPRQLYNILMKHQGKKETLERRELQSIEEYAKIIVFKGEELYAKLDESRKDEELEALITRLKTDRKQRKLDDIHKQIQAAESEANGPRVQDLLATYNQLLREE